MIDHAQTVTERRLRIDVWSDIACPWCYIGAARLTKAVAASPHAGSVDVVTRSFELDPQAPTDVRPLREFLAAKMGVTTAQAAQMEGQMSALAAQDDLPYAADRVHGNTFDAHRVHHLARSLDLGDAVFRALQEGLFSGRKDAYDHAFLIEAAVGAGVARPRVEEVLAGGEFADAVRADEAEARRLRITGVPFAVLDGRLGVPGAVSVEGYAQAIEQAWGQE